MSLLGNYTRDRTMFQIMTQLTESLQQSEEIQLQQDEIDQEQETDTALQNCQEFFNYTYQFFQTDEKFDLRNLIPEGPAQYQDQLSSESMRRLCYSFVDQARRDFSRNCDFRVCAFRWFNFYFQWSMDQQGNELDENFQSEVNKVELEWAIDALQIVLFMCRDFALGNDDMCKNAYRLLANIEYIQIVEKVSEFPGWIEQLQVQEINCWKNYYSVMFNFLQFNNRIKRIEGEFTALEKDILSQQGAELLNQVIQLLKYQWLEYIQQNLIGKFQEQKQENEDINQNINNNNNNNLSNNNYENKLIYQLFMTMVRDDEKYTLPEQFLEQLCRQLTVLYQNKLLETQNNQIQIQVEPYYNNNNQSEGVMKVVVSCEDQADEAAFLRMAKILTFIVLNEWKLSGMGSLLIMGAEPVSGDPFGVVTVALNLRVCISYLCQVGLLVRQQLVNMGIRENIGDELLKIIAQEKISDVLPSSKLQWILKMEAGIQKSMA